MIRQEDGISAVWRVHMLVCSAALSLASGVLGKDNPVARSFEISPGVSVNLALPEGWQGVHEESTQGQDDKIRIITSNGESFTLNVVPLWNLGPGGGPITPEGMGLLEVARTSRIFATAAKETFRFHPIGGSVQDVWVVDFVDAGAASEEERYVTHASVTLGHDDVLLDTTVRMNAPRTVNIGRLLAILGSAQLERVERVVSGPALSESESNMAGLLLPRVNAYHELMTKGKYREAIGMWPKRYSEDEARIAQNIEEAKRWARIARPRNWEITDIWLSGEYGRVDVSVGGAAKDKGRWVEGTEKMTEYWVFEDGDWYFFPKQLEDWNSEKSKHVPPRVIREWQSR